jgi:hypothetical protein
MGTLSFQLPALLADDPSRHELERSCVTGGQDNMPFPTDACVERERLVLSRCVNEAGSMQIQAPWQIDGIGQLMICSATLMERQEPYHLGVELARGKLNQLRTQLAEWTQGGLIIPEALTAQIRAATHSFSQAIMAQPNAEAARLAQESLKLACKASHELAHVYMRRVFELRHERQPKFDTWLSCRLETDRPADDLVAPFTHAFNAVAMPFHWQEIEPQRHQYSWDKHDRLADWAHEQGLKIIGGPLIDFGGRHLPEWIWDNANDLTSLSAVLSEYVDTIVRRYHTRIRTWQISAGSNCAGVLARHDAELIWLTLRLAETVKRVQPNLDVIVGIAQPWGDYLAEQERSKTPFIFADDLLRTGIKLAALDLELIMGISPRGSYCRDLLDASRLLDLYALLGVPIQATLGYPSSSAASELSCPDQRVNLGNWRGPYSEATQADWVIAFGPLMLCKPYVRGVQWAHWSDAEPHQFPHCGIVGAGGQVKPTLARLTQLRAEHLK